MPKPSQWRVRKSTDCDCGGLPESVICDDMGRRIAFVMDSRHAACMAKSKDMEELLTALLECKLKAEFVSVQSKALALLKQGSRP